MGLNFSVDKYPQGYKEWILALKKGEKYSMTINESENKYDEETWKALEIIETFDGHAKSIAKDEQNWYNESRKSWKKENKSLMWNLYFDQKQENMRIVSRIASDMNNKMSGMSEETNKINKEWNNKIMETLEKEMEESYEKYCKEEDKKESNLPETLPSELMVMILTTNEYCKFWKQLIDLKPEDRLKFLKENKPKKLSLPSVIEIDFSDNDSEDTKKELV